MSETRNPIRNIATIPPACQERYLPLDGAPAAPLRALGATYAGMSDLVPGYHIGVPQPSRVMLIATVSGKGRLHTRARSYELTPQSLLVAAPVCPWEYYVIGRQWRILWCYFKAAPQQATMRECDITLSSPWSTTELENAMEGYLASDRSLERRLLYARIAASLFSEILCAPSQVASQTQPDKLAEVLAEVRQSPELLWTLPGIAARLSMSVSTVQRLIRQTRGTTVWQEILRIRIEAAQQLLRHTDYPLKAIAARVGYADEFVFSTAFKRAVGVAPALWRR